MKNTLGCVLSWQWVLIFLWTSYHECNLFFTPLTSGFPTSSFLYENRFLLCLVQLYSRTQHRTLHTVRRGYVYFWHKCMKWKMRLKGLPQFWLQMTLHYSMLSVHCLGLNSILLSADFLPRLLHSPGLKSQDVNLRRKYAFLCLLIR